MRPHRLLTSNLRSTAGKRESGTREKAVDDLRVLRYVFGGKILVDREGEEALGEILSIAARDFVGGLQQRVKNFTEGEQRDTAVAKLVLKTSSIAQQDGISPWANAFGKNREEFLEQRVFFESGIQQLEVAAARGDDGRPIAGVHDALAERGHLREGQIFAEEIGVIHKTRKRC